MIDHCPRCGSRDLMAAHQDAPDDGWEQCLTCDATWNVHAGACDPSVAREDCPRCIADAADNERCYQETALYYARMGDGADDAPADDAPDVCFCGAPLHGFAGPCGDCRARQA